MKPTTEKFAREFIRMQFIRDTGFAPAYNTIEVMQIEDNYGYIRFRIGRYEYEYTDMPLQGRRIDMVAKDNKLIGVG